MGWLGLTLAILFFMYNFFVIEVIDRVDQKGVVFCVILMFAPMIFLVGAAVLASSCINESHREAWCNDQVPYSGAQIVEDGTHCYVDGQKILLPHWLAE